MLRVGPPVRGFRAKCWLPAYRNSPCRRNVRERPSVIASGPAACENACTKQEPVGMRGRCSFTFSLPGCYPHTQKNLPGWLLVGLQFFAGPVLGIVLWTVVPGLAAIYEDQKMSHWSMGVFRSLG